MHGERLTWEIRLLKLSLVTREGLRLMATPLVTVPEYNWLFGLCFSLYSSAGVMIRRRAVGDDVINIYLRQQKDLGDNRQTGKQIHN